MGAPLRIVTVCNAGRERSRVLAASLESTLAKEGIPAEVIARGSFGLGSDDKGVATEYGWVPPEGLVNLMKKNGLDFPTYASSQITKGEAAAADYIIVVDPVVAERITKTFPEYAGKIINPLDLVSPEDNPFPDYIGNSIPDAWGGHLAKPVHEALAGKGSHEEKMSRLVKLLGGALEPEHEQFARDYIEGKIHPAAIRQIPASLRDYVGHGLDTEEAYHAEVENLGGVAKALYEGGHLNKNKDAA